MKNNKDLSDNFQLKVIPRKTIQGANSSTGQYVAEPMFVERKVSNSQCKQKMMSFRGQARRANVTSPGDKLTALTCHLTK
jgi:hypothetical protein